MSTEITVIDRDADARGHEPTRIDAAFVGSDHYVNGHGGTDWKLAALLRVIHAEGPDVSRATAERAGAEAFWLPTTLLPRFGVTWSASDDTNITAHFEVDGHPMTVDYRIERHGFVESLVFRRWHEPDANGAWATASFGGDLTAYRTATRKRSRS